MQPALNLIWSVTWSILSVVFSPVQGLRGGARAASRGRLLAGYGARLHDLRDKARIWCERFDGGKGGDGYGMAGG